MADAILDRLLHNSHKLKLKGESKQLNLITCSDTIRTIALGRSGGQIKPELLIGITGIRRLGPFVMTIDVIITPIAEHVETYQTLWAGILGFLGIMYTLHKNSENQLKLQAHQIKHELELRSEQKTHETNTLRVALKSELTSNIDIYNGRVEGLNKPTGNLVVIPTKTFDATYLSLRDRLGSLTEEEVDNVLRAYQLIDEFPYRLRNVIRIEECGSIHDEYLLFDVDRWGYIIDLHRVFIAEFKKAVESLNKNLGVEDENLRTDKPLPETNRQQPLTGALSDHPVECSSPQ